MSETPEYVAWSMMRQRCTNPNAPNFHRYGGRGITICAAWDDFRAFLRDMGPRPSGAHSLDRIDNDGHYGPDNCRWATSAEQTANKSTNRRFAIDGQQLILRDVAARAGLNVSTLYYRVRRGIPIEQAVAMRLHQRHR